MNKMENSSMSLLNSVTSRYSNESLAKLMWKISLKYADVLSSREVAIMQSASKRLSVAEEPCLDDYAPMLKFERSMESLNVYNENESSR